MQGAKKEMKGRMISHFYLSR